MSDPIPYRYRVHRFVTDGGHVARAESRVNRRQFFTAALAAPITDTAERAKQTTDTASIDPLGREYALLLEAGIVIKERAERGLVPVQEPISNRDAVRAPRLPPIGDAIEQYEQEIATLRRELEGIWEA